MVKAVGDPSEEGGVAEDLRRKGLVSHKFKIGHVSFRGVQSHRKSSTERDGGWQDVRSRPS